MDAKVAGILSGVSYVSGIDYYKGINEQYGELVGSGTGLMPRNPLMIMVSVECDAYAKYLCDKEWGKAQEHLLQGVAMLVKAGVDFIGLASNTAHICSGLVRERYPDVPLVHIADTTAAAIKKAGLSKVGLLGTEPTMRESYLKDQLAKHGIEVMVPDDDEVLSQIFQYIMKELGVNVFKDSTRAYFVEAARGLQARGAQGIILGCTEIELLIQQKHIPDFPVFPSAELHIAALAKVAAGQAQPSEYEP
eukprot:TRINITY_DN16567_c0_g1_i1.p1 TRINITY_DN16567_c0_g1~~TRINITY_DN16567_c0_g1_i1.p1  ORF type:complete len:249 (+),score=99.68 TRINITY_DN16567_c0_g1_i1:759-1505(+)